MADKPEEKSWWERNVEDAADERDALERKAIGKYDYLGLVKHDIGVGIEKAEYKFVKAAVVGLVDLAKYNYHVYTADPETMENNWRIAKTVATATWAWIVRPPLSVEERNAQTIRENEAFFEMCKTLYHGVKAEWDKAGKTDGKQTELVAEWTTRSFLEVAPFFFGVGEAKAALEGPEVISGASKLARTGRILDETEIGCKTIVMSNEAILAEIEPKMAASAKAADEAAAAAKAAKAAQDAKEAAAAAKAAPKIKLGLGLKNKNTDYVKWSKEKGFNTYGELSGRGSFSEQIDQAMKAADEIHFNMKDLETNRASGTLNEFGEPLNRNYTNYELYLVKTKFRAKTLWHAADGTVMPKGWMPPGF